MTLVARIDELVNDISKEDKGRQDRGDRKPDGDVWSLHARVDRAVSDYLGSVALRAEDPFEPDPYTLLLVKSTLTRRRWLNPLQVMAGSRPFRPAFEAIEDALLKPIVHEALDPDLTFDERETRIMDILAGWIPLEDYNKDREDDA